MKTIINLFIVIFVASFNSLAQIASPSHFIAEDHPIAYLEETVERINTLSEKENSVEYPTQYHTIEINEVEIFYREAGDKNAPTIVLLHGYPTSSHMFRNLIQDLSSDYHLIAPDYPGFGRSEQPPMAEFDYTFENFAVSIPDGIDPADYAAVIVWCETFGEFITSASYQ